MPNLRSEQDEINSSIRTAIEEPQNINSASTIQIRDIFGNIIAETNEGTVTFSYTNLYRDTMQNNNTNNIQRYYYNEFGNLVRLEIDDPYDNSVVIHYMSDTSGIRLFSHRNGSGINNNSASSATFRSLQPRSNI